MITNSNRAYFAKVPGCLVQEEALGKEALALNGEDFLDSNLKQRGSLTFNILSYDPFSSSRLDLEALYINPMSVE
jgi:hypothetical protein